MFNLVVRCFLVQEIWTILQGGLLKTAFGFSLFSLSILFAAEVIIDYTTEENLMISAEKLLDPVRKLI
ncbi:hypothetical protein A9P44_18890 [Paenibacillus polymyxa]|nr:hypothetical protein A9P44_18890 [Paenibacillus polymyxa]